MRVLLERAESEIEVKKSRFIAIAMPIKASEDVRKCVESIWKEHPDATHVVHAAVIGKSGTIYSSSDDREPKNTAGRPALEVLKGSGITDIIVCIVRYFGGTLLGTGGLVKAYSDSCKEVLRIVRTEELIERKRFSLLIDYSSYTPIRRLLDRVEATEVKEVFETGISITGLIPEAKADEFRSGAADIGQGRLRVEIT
ncbi:MAG: YigZ family protein [Candidatus Ornithospirochaeta sp.]|nr:YigZ family protein [Candidatus Ornithospirochaeta sp.]